MFNLNSKHETRNIDFNKFSILCNKTPYYSKQ